MLILIFIACLMTNISVIKCIETFQEINVRIEDSDKCIVDPESRLPAGYGAVVKVKNDGNGKVRTSQVDKKANDQQASEAFNFTVSKNTATNSLYVYIPNDSYNKSYNLFFKFSYEAEHRNKNNVRSMCDTTVLFDPITDKPALLQNNDRETYMAIGGVLAGILIIALFATIMYYKRRANYLSKHINLERRMERADENERYCSNPRKGQKVTPIINSRDSDIYEDPKFTLGVSSIPPALPTSPRPNRSNCSTLRIPPSPSMTLGNASHPTFPRPKVTDRENQMKMSMAQRPPLPLPQDDNNAEEAIIYEDPEQPSPTTLTRKPRQQDRIGMIPEKNARPIPENIMKPRPEKIVNTFEKKLGKPLPNIPMDGLKPPGMNRPPKPAIPKGKPTPPRNNVVQVPIREIPETGSMKKAPFVKPKPNAKPKTPPSPTLEQEVHFFNEDRRDSTDDEYWTYEPLQKYNIYNN